ncbi:MAG TPA: substrate-binding domain-containing protein [Planctomycetota bacterium]|nr:substrate-binding domain-containing protein [Planctomycetota bacterium]
MITPRLPQTPTNGVTSRKRIAIMLDLDWPYRRHFDIFVGTQQFANEHGWECVIDEFADVTLRTEPARYDGVLGRVSSALAKAAKAHNVPVVNVWFNSPVAPAMPGVFPDFSESGRLAAEHLLERGFRHFACLSGTGDRAQRMELDAFHETIGKRGHTCSCAVVERQYAKDARVWKQFKRTISRWIAQWQPPTGVYVTFPDATGRHIAEAAREHSLAIPEQVALVVNENDPVLCQHPSPSLSSIDIPYNAIGYQAASILNALMNGQPVQQPLQFMEPAGITARQSTDFLAVDDELVATALRWISKLAHQPIGVDDVCRASFAGRRTLERRFSRVLGRTVAEEIQRLRLERAKRELAHAGTPIKQVARLAGFKDAKRLHEVFVREIGQSPSSYRERLKLR